MSESRSPEQTHAEVKDAYTRAIEKAEKSGCCATPVPKRAVAAELAGYQDHPAALEVASFGCGNPLAYAEVGAGQTVLDLGSGAGLDLLLAADKVGPEGRVIGVDMTDAMIEAARRNIAKAGHQHVEVRRGTIEDLPVESATVDWVISNCVINLSPQKSRVFAEIARVLRPGGRFSISDIVVEDLPDWLRQNAAVYSACVGGAISEAEYLDGLRAAGLTDVKVADRLVYDRDQLLGVVGSDLTEMGIPQKFIDEGLEQVTGKIWSAKFVGRRA